MDTVPSFQCSAGGSCAMSQVGGQYEYAQRRNAHGVAGYEAAIWFQCRKCARYKPMHWDFYHTYSNPN